MNSILISVVVTFVFVVIQAVIGARLGKAGKPYNSAAVAAHVILTLFILAGLAASIYKLAGLTAGKMYPMTALHIAGLALLVNIINGIVMSVNKKDSQPMVLTHKLTTFLMIISIIAAVIFLAVKI